MEEELEELKDIWIKCIGYPGYSCDRDFIFTVGEQKFYKSRGLFTPKRCNSCRDKMRKLVMQKKASETA